MLTLSYSLTQKSAAMTFGGMEARQRNGLEFLCCIVFVGESTNTNLRTSLSRKPEAREELLMDEYSFLISAY